MFAAVLNRPTLVLNRNWYPVDVSTVSRSLVKVWSGGARIVDPSTYQQYSWADWARQTPDHDEPFIQTVMSRLRVPEVITLTGYDRMPDRLVPFSRRNVFKRDRYTCQYCGRRPGSSELTIDHVVPRSHGGGTSWENCVLACISCNSRKGSRTPERSGMLLKKPPVRPIWRPEFMCRHVKIDSWSKFLSEAYWNVELED